MKFLYSNIYNKVIYVEAEPEYGALDHTFITVTNKILV